MLWRGSTGESRRTPTQAQEMFEKVPSSQRASTNTQDAAINADKYFSDKDANHIKAHSKGDSNEPSNIKWENAKDNRARGNEDMTWTEKAKIDTKWHFDNLTGGMKAGVKATPMGAIIGVINNYCPFFSVNQWFAGGA